MGAARVLLLVALLAVFASLAPSRQATAASAGLVAAYGFDEGSGTTVTDASGNGNTGTIANATWVTTGKYGKALQFNGTSTPRTLHAYDPSNLAHEYDTSDQAGTRDQLDPWLKFTIPLVANGRMYVVSAGQLTAFGLLP